MNRNKKYILIASLGILSIIGMSVQNASATIRSRLSSYFGTIRNTFRGQRGNTTDTSSNNVSAIEQSLQTKSKLNHPATNNLNTSSLSKENLEKVEKLAIEGRLAGIYLNDFDPHNVFDVQDNAYYYQRYNGDRNRVTTTSLNKPKVTDVEGEKITVEFKNVIGKTEKIVSQGLPMWTFGSDIKRKQLEDPNFGRHSFHEQIVFKPFDN